MPDRKIDAAGVVVKDEFILADDASLFSRTRQATRRDQFSVFAPDHVSIVVL